MKDKASFSDFIRAISDSNSITQVEAEKLIRGTFGQLLVELEKEGKASITNFGSFEIKEISERAGQNPQTGEEIVIPAHKRISFKPYKALENSVNAPFTHLTAELIEENQTKAPAPLIESNKKSNTSKFLIPILLVLISIIGLIWFLNRNKGLESKDTTTTAKIEAVAPKSEEVQTPVSQTETEVMNSASTSNNVEELNSTSQVINQSSSTLATNGSYRVNKDEWFWDISREIYGAPQYWPILFVENFSENSDPDILSINKILSIPVFKSDPNRLTSSDNRRLYTSYTLVANAYRNVGKNEKADSYDRLARVYNSDN